MIRIYLSLALLLFIQLSSKGQVDSLIINEIGGTGNSSFFELKNLSSDDVDPSDLFIIYNGNTIAMNTISAVCAFPGSNRVIDAGAQQAFRFTVSNISGELVLSKTNSIVSPDDVISYVNWGDYDSSIEAFAVSAMKWELNTSGPAFFMTGSIEYNEQGFNGTNWIIQAVPSPCRENFTGCDLRTPNVSIDDDLVCVCSEDPTFLSISMSGNVADTIFGVLVRDDNTIAAITNFPNDIDSFLDGVCIDSLSQLSYLVLGYDGEIRKFEIGNKTDDLIGCYILSEKISLNTVKLEKPLTIITIDGIEADLYDPIEICRIDQNDEVIVGLGSPLDSIVYYIVDEGGDIVYESAGLGSVAIDYSSLPAGNFGIVAVHFFGERRSSIGNDILSPSIEGCISISNIGYLLTLDTNLPNCTSSVSDNILSGDIKFQLTDNNLNIIVGDKYNSKNCKVEVYSISGRRIHSSDIFTQKENNIELNIITTGVYIVNLELDGKIISKRLFSS